MDYDNPSGNKGRTKVGTSWFWILHLPSLIAFLLESRSIPYSNNLSSPNLYLKSPYLRFHWALG